MKFFTFIKNFNVLFLHFKTFWDSKVGPELKKKHLGVIDIYQIGVREQLAWRALVNDYVPQTLYKTRKNSFGLDYVAIHGSGESNYTSMLYINFINKITFTEKVEI